MAWAAAIGGRWAALVTPVRLSGPGAENEIVQPGAEVLLEDLAPGPDGEAFVLWGEPAPSPTGAPELARQALFATRSTDAGPEGFGIGEPEPISPPGPVAGARLAVDPASGRAVASWRGQSGSIEYSIRRAEPGR
jgi:hypothetical protein